jgi:hypothetical protein
MSLIIELSNDGTGTSEVSNYDYVIKIKGRVLEAGKIRNHITARGWKVLLYHLAMQVNKDKIFAEVQRDAQENHSKDEPVS